MLYVVIVLLLELKVSDKNWLESDWSHTVILTLNIAGSISKNENLLFYHTTWFFISYNSRYDIRKVIKNLILLMWVSDTGQILNRFTIRPFQNIKTPNFKIGEFRISYDYLFARPFNSVAVYL